jgi:tetratricopeptide (TPR) repeat protein
MKPKLLILVPALFFLGACAPMSVAPTVEAGKVHPEAKTVKPVEPAAVAPAVAEPVAVPAAQAEPEKAPAESALTGQILYQFLLGEIAAQRGDLKLASEAYADLAIKTRDVRVVRRAAEMAIYDRDMAKAAEMSKLWVQLEPQSEQARQLLVTSLISLGRLDEAKPLLESFLSVEGQPVGPAFAQVQNLLALSKNKPAALALLKELAAEYPSIPEAHLAVAQSEIGLGQNDQALTELDEALRLTPDSETAALLKGQAWFGQDDATRSLAYWKDFLVRYPDATRVRLAYARGLVRAGQFDGARGEFETLLKKSPDSPELHLAVGLLSMQMNDLDGAERHFSQALTLGYPDQGLIEMYLGQVNEMRQRYDQALEWYRKVTTGEHAFQAGLKAAMMLGQLHKVDEALDSLKKMDAEGDGDNALRIVQTEAQILRDSGRYQDAVDLLSQSLEKTPDAGDLLYDRAMLEEKLDNLPAMETDLRRLIKLQPDSAQAYNALGYTLVDRTNRIEEGVALLDKALKLSPNDAFILDSMGWGQYKAGRLDESVDYLRRAYKGRADPEIAAHLGEVLWKKGEQDEARQIWQEAMKLHPENDLLRKTMSSFGQ